MQGKSNQVTTMDHYSNFSVQNLTFYFHDLELDPMTLGLSKKKHEKKIPLSEEKKHNFSKKKKTLFNIISFLKRVFCLPFLHKISPFNMFKTINYLFLFFNISKKPYFTKQQTPLMIIVSHNFKEIIFFIRIDQEV